MAEDHGAGAEEEVDVLVAGDVPDVGALGPGDDEGALRRGIHVAQSAAGDDAVRTLNQVLLVVGAWGAGGHRRLLGVGYGRGPVHSMASAASGQGRAEGLRGRYPHRRGVVSTVQAAGFPCVLGAVYQWLRPPSMSMMAPVVHEAASEAR